MRDAELFDLFAKSQAGTPIGAVRPDGTFSYFAPISFFEKGAAPSGQTRRFGGVSTDEDEDQEGETILQRGLDWSYFLDKGYFNDNHKQGAGDVIGYPDKVDYYKKGATLPDGTIAKANCHWTEGYLLEGVDAADKIWKVGNALQKTGGARRLGQSIEGKIEKRMGAGGNIIARARVINTALTHCPVNAGTSLSFLAKALHSVESGEMSPTPVVGDPFVTLAEAFRRAMTATTGTQVSPPGSSPAQLGEVTGEGAAQVLAPESLERRCATTTSKALNPNEQFALIRSRFPQLSAAACGRMLDTIHTMART